MDVVILVPYKISKEIKRWGRNKKVKLHPQIIKNKVWKKCRAGKYPVMKVDIGR